MKVRIKFDADIVITGDNMAEVREKFEGMELWSQQAKDCHVEFSEIKLVEDADTYEDLEHKYNHCQDNNEQVCPECGHVFEQGECNYNYDTGHTDYECPDCGWVGNERQFNTEDGE
jgi:predicted RNA-binding Zn-ribbon protein involved in translation (DUF1610 family)